MTGETTPWHALPAAEVAQRLDTTSVTGLSAADAQRRLAEHGRNEVPEAPGRSVWARLWGQANNPLIIVLIVAGAMCLVLRDYIDAVVILGVVVINVIIGFIQEGKAEQAIAAVRAMLAAHATVVRDGERRRIDAAELVPGDIVLLESGDRVPADVRILREHNLRTEESALTGESVPVEKDVEQVIADAVIGDRICMAFSGTLVVYGQARTIVTATGAATELGRIGELVGQAPDLSTPLTNRLAQFSLQITWIILAAGAFAFAWATLITGLTPLNAFLAVVGFAVAAIPEGMPAVVTIVLAIGTRVMAANRAVVRRLPAVETLGSVTVICSDKTGTLTRNEMTAVRLLLPGADIMVSGAGYEPVGGFRLDSAAIEPDEHEGIAAVATAGLLCNDADVRCRDEQWHAVGDPTEAALVTLALKAGLRRDELAQRHPRVDEIPFESQQQFMATLHRDHQRGNSFVVVKGAPERVLAMCGKQRQQGWHQRTEQAAANGERVLALARASVPGTTERLDADALPDGFELLGMVGLQDPPRPEAITAVRRCQNAGVAVKMITGDHAATAAAIGAELGLQAGEPLTGSMIEALDDQELRSAAGRAEVIARASPEHKMRLVAALQATGNYVAMTGDGANDAPALKAADIGVAMGQRGTDAAREAADLVLTDDNFATIERAVERGRVVYDNIKKSLAFMIPTNGGQAAVILMALLFSITLPISVAQILWINMVSAVTLALALAFEPAEPDIMDRPPRPPTQALFTRPMAARVAFVSVLMAAITLAAFEFQLAQGSSLEVSRTAAVNALVCGEVFYLFNCRRYTAHAFTVDTLRGNRAVWLVVGILVLLQLALTYLPFLQRVFATQGLGPSTWGIIVALGLATFLVVEAEKALWRRAGVDQL